MNKAKKSLIAAACCLLLAGCAQEKEILTDAQWREQYNKEGYTISEYGLEDADTQIRSGLIDFSGAKKDSISLVYMSYLNDENAKTAFNNYKIMYENTFEFDDYTVNEEDRLIAYDKENSTAVCIIRTGSKVMVGADISATDTKNLEAAIQ